MQTPPKNQEYSLGCIEWQVKEVEEKEQLNFSKKSWFLVNSLINVVEGDAMSKIVKCLDIRLPLPLSTPHQGPAAHLHQQAEHFHLWASQGDPGLVQEG